MKKIILISLLAIFIMACKENTKSTIVKNINEITFKELDSIKAEPEAQIIRFLETHKYKLLKNEYENQWVSTTNDEMIQFSKKGVFVFFTFNVETYNKLVLNLNKSTYKNFGKTMKNGVEVDSYIRDNETIFITTMMHPQNGKQVYSLTFLS